MLLVSKRHDNGTIAVEVSDSIRTVHIELSETHATTGLLDMQDGKVCQSLDLIFLFLVRIIDQAAGMEDRIPMTRMNLKISYLFQNLSKCVMDGTSGYR